MALKMKLNLTSQLTNKILRLANPSCQSCANNRFLHASSKLATSFHEQDIKGAPQYRAKEKSEWFHIKNGIKLLGPEFRLFYEEMKEELRQDAPIVLPGDYDIVWKLDNQDSVGKWSNVSDSDHNEGFSTCTFVLNENRKGFFSGNLSPKRPKDGRVKRAGYCNIKLPRVTKSFHRNTYLDWSEFTHLLVRLRGDGRTYIMNLHTEGYFDLQWHDIYSYALFTRGGPYWQTAMIPFSKFVLTSKGKIQDKQAPIPLDMISSVGITLMDSFTGPFQLEIDYIGIYNNPRFKEEFAYELYDTPNYMFGA